MKSAVIDNHSKWDHDLKAVLFDYGEVLCHAPTAEENARLAAFFGISAERLILLHGDHSLDSRDSRFRQPPAI
jgi:hypothetical protein